MMNRILLLTIVALYWGHVNADSFRCGRKVVKLGESSNALIKKCGAPVRKYSSKEMVSEDGRQQRVGVSNWVYERRGKKDMIVSVRSGTIMKLQIE
jgi:hypothetical protein